MKLRSVLLAVMTLVSTVFCADTMEAVKGVWALDQEAFAKALKKKDPKLTKAQIERLVNKARTQVIEMSATQMDIYVASGKYPMVIKSIKIEGKNTIIKLEDRVTFTITKIGKDRIIVDNGYTRKPMRPAKKEDMAVFTLDGVTGFWILDEDAFVKALKKTQPGLAGEELKQAINRAKERKVQLEGKRMTVYTAKRSSSARLKSIKNDGTVVNVSTDRQKILITRMGEGRISIGQRPMRLATKEEEAEIKRMVAEAKKKR